jgi:hypothetical protein
VRLVLVVARLLLAAALARRGKTAFGGSRNLRQRLEVRGDALGLPGQRPARPWAAKCTSALKHSEQFSSWIALLALLL